MSEINNALLEIKNQAKEYLGILVGTNKSGFVEAAYKYKAIVRFGETSEAQTVLLLLIIYATSGLSLRVAAAIGFIDSGINVSDEAWRQRFLKCGAWLLFLLECSLNSIAPTALLFNYNGNDMDVYLIDASMFKQEGKTGAELRLHMCYNLTKRVMEEVIVTDKRTAEGAKTFTVKPGSLYIGDAGYGKGVHLECIASQNAFALFRLTPNQVILAKDINGKKKVDLPKLFKTKKKLLDFRCFVHTRNKKYIPVRIIAGRLPEDKALLARENKIRESKRRQSQIREATLVYSEWVVLMTNVGDKHHAASLLKLYRSRWQIELLFKRIKQFFNVKRLKKASPEHSKILILTWLLVWSAVEKESLAAEIRLLEQGEDISRYSPWVVSMLFLKKIETLINAYWALSFNHTVLSDVYRQLRNHKSSRFNQYAQTSPLWHFLA